MIIKVHARQLRPLVLEARCTAHVAEVSVHGDVDAVFAWIRREVLAHLDADGQRGVVT